MRSGDDRATGTMAMRHCIALALLLLVWVTGCRASEQPADAVLDAYLRMHAEALNTPAGDDPTPVTFVVRPGETARDIGVRLEQAGLVRDAELFRLLARQRGVADRLQAGEYQLRATMTVVEVLEALQHARPPVVRVTIPEGWRAEEIAALLEAKGVVSAKAFLYTLRSHVFDYPYLPQGTLEGYLFPDTYEFKRESDPVEVIGRMLATFDRRFDADMRARAAARGLTVHQVVTLASIVEREAVIPEERPLIAGVFLNRLAKGMPLEADPTVQYALGYQAESRTWWKRPLTLADLQVNSPYNTYRNPGLPPGPICNPGLASLQAVVDAPETPYYYFVADGRAGDGSHLFARTWEEHIANIRQAHQE